LNKKGGCLKVLGITFGSFMLLFIILMIIAVNSSNTTSTDATQTVKTTQTTNTTQALETAATEPAKPELELLEINSKSDEYSKYAVGKIKNNSKKEYSYVQVEINLYNKSGELIGSTLSNINNLAPGETWSFKAIILEDEATKFSVKDINGW